MEKKNSGITLLALIITIIIMLILAGVTINIVAGSDGIIAKAEKTVSETDKAAMKEDVELSIAAIKMDYYEDYASNRAKYANAKAFIVAKLETPYETSRGATMTADSAGNVNYTYKGVITVVTIDDDGKVTLGESSEETEEETVDYSYLFKFDASTGTILGIKEEYYGDTPNVDYYQSPNSTMKDYNYMNGYGGCVLTEPIDTLVVPNKINGVDVKTVKYIGVLNVRNLVFEEGIENIECAYRLHEVSLSYWYTADTLMKTILESVIIPKTVTSIGAHAFDGCIALKEIDTQNVTTIGECAFFECTSLNSVNMPNVTNIGVSAFNNCTSLSSVSMPNVTSIGSSAFNWCTNLSIINIPESVTTIGYMPFCGWTASQTINCEATSKPSGWDAKWDYYNYNTARKAQLNWGVSM